MDKSAIAFIDTYVGRLFSTGGREEDEIPFSQPTPFYLGARHELLPGRTGEVETVQLIDGHGKAAAIETLFRGRAAPLIGKADEAFGRLHDLVPEIRGAVNPCPGQCVVIGADNVILSNDAGIDQIFNLGPGRLPGRKIAEADLEEPCLVMKIVGVLKIFK